MKKLLIASAGCAISLSLPALSDPHPVAACSCLRLPPTAIFAGEAVATQPISRGPWQTPGVEVTFAVERAWMGPGGRELRVHTNRASDDACGYPFRLGEQYLVFASIYPPGTDQLATSDCSGTRLIAEAEEDLAVLGRIGWNPLLVRHWADPYATRGIGWALGLGVLVAAIGTGLMLLVYRRKQHRAR